MPQVEVEPVTEFITNDLYNWATEANMVNGSSGPIGKLLGDQHQ